MLHTAANGRGLGNETGMQSSVLGLELDLGGERNITEAGSTFIPGAHFTNRLVFIGILHVNKYH